MLAPFVFFHLALFFYRRHTVHVHIGWIQLSVLESANRERDDFGRPSVCMEPVHVSTR